MEQDVSLQQLVHLLELGHESAPLDYKRSCDLTDLRTQLEIAKDVAAMQVSGGHIVVGADDHGIAVPPGLLPEHEKLFDEATLRAKLSRWIPEPYGLRSSIHRHDGCTFAIVYVEPRASGFCVMKDDGKYLEERQERDRKERFVFRRGDVFARHGSASERWTQADIERIFEGEVARRKEIWRQGLAGDLEALGVARVAQALVGGPTENFTWQLDAATFEAAALELLRRDDDIPLRHVLTQAPAEAARLVESGAWDDAATLVARLTSVAGLSLTYERPRWFRDTVTALHRVYEIGFDSFGQIRTDVGPRLWLLILEHLLAVGGLAVRLQNWAAVHHLTVQRPGGADDYYPTWLRHAVTTAARANILLDEDRRSSKSLVTLAVARAVEIAALRTDVSEHGDAVLTSVCQFDILAALTVISATGSLDNRGWYTNFARFYASRSEPAVKRLLTDTAMRAELFPSDDSLLSAALREIDRLASSEGWQYNGWHGYSAPTILEFLERHPT
jgi:hypothetical protein